MHLKSFAWRQALSISVLALSATSAALAQSWPQKPIKVIAPYPPGGPSDLVMRTAVTFHHIEANPFSAFRSHPVFGI